MKKYIQEITCCRYCPNREQGESSIINFCTLSDIFINFAKIDIIPDWCELEDY